MGKIGMMVSRNRLEFQRNGTLSGHSVTSTVASAGCRDVIAAHLGEKAHAHLEALGVRIWEGPAGTPVSEVNARHGRGELKAWSVAARPGGSGCTPDGSGHGDHRHADHGGPAAPAPLTRLRRPGPGDQDLPKP
jgi:predicted Fe-Mo cluster-binding NifX family protein